MGPVYYKYHGLQLKSTFKIFLTSVAIAGIVFTLSISTTIYIKHDLDNQAEHEFALVCNEIKTKIYSRLNTQSLLLQSCASFISVSDTITRNDWKLFIENSKIFQNLYGYQGLAFNIIIPKEKLKQHDNYFSKTGTTNHSVSPTDEQDTYTSIVYIEPYSKENIKAIGYDTYSEPIRRRAMEYARDFNLTTLTEKLTLVQETQINKQPGIIMYTPVYRRNLPVSNVKERRAAIIGWVSCPYRMEGLMMNILGPWGLDIQNNNKIHLVIYDNDTITPSSILFDSHKNDTIFQNDLSVQMVINPILFNKKNWTLRFSQSKEQYSYFKGKSLVVLIISSFVSLLLFYLSFALFRTWQKAKQLSYEMEARDNELFETKEK
jgi:CHASE1-domain containing sensor protein